MTDYCVDLNLSINPLIDGISIDDLQEKNEIWTLIKLDFINPELKELFKVLGLKMKVAGLFVLNENSIGLKHLDGPDISDLTKINWSYNTDHNMIWYKVKPNNIEKNVSERISTENLPSRPHVKYKDDELEEIHRCQVNFPSLIQAGIPHNVENYEGVRRCLSILLYDNNDKTVPMYKAKEIFSQYLVLSTGIEPVFTT